MSSAPKFAFESPTLPLFGPPSISKLEPGLIWTEKCHSMADYMFLQAVLTHLQWALCIDHWHNRACLVQQQWGTEIKQAPLTSQRSQVTDMPKHPLRQTLSFQHTMTLHYVWCSTRLFEKWATSSPNPITPGHSRKGFISPITNYSLNIIVWASHWLVVPLLSWFVFSHSPWLLRTTNT